MIQGFALHYRYCSKLVVWNTVIKASFCYCVWNLWFRGDLPSILLRMSWRQQNRKWHVLARLWSLPSSVKGSFKTCWCSFDWATPIGSVMKTIRSKWLAKKDKNYILMRIKVIWSRTSYRHQRKLSNETAFSGTRDGPKLTCLQERYNAYSFVWTQWPPLDWSVNFWASPPLGTENSKNREFGIWNCFQKIDRKYNHFDYFEQNWKVRFRLLSWATFYPRMPCCTRLSHIPSPEP